MIQVTYHISLCHLRIILQNYKLVKLKANLLLRRYKFFHLESEIWTRTDSFICSKLPKTSLLRDRSHSFVEGKIVGTSWRRWISKCRYHNSTCASEWLYTLQIYYFTVHVLFVCVCLSLSLSHATDLSSWFLKIIDSSWILNESKSDHRFPNVNSRF